MRGFWGHPGLRGPDTGRSSLFAHVLIRTGILKVHAEPRANPNPNPHLENLRPPWQPGISGNAAGYSRCRRISAAIEEEPER